MIRITTYAYILQIFGYCNFIVSVIFTIYGYICPDNVKGGTFFNSLGCILWLPVFFGMIILFAVFVWKVGSEVEDRLFSVNIVTIIIYVLLGINLIYRLFFNSGIDIENGSSFTGEKLMTGFALGLLVNLTVIIETSNFLK